MSPELLKVTLDTIWVLTAGILVFLMQAGFSLFEGGMVRSKNAVNVIMKNYINLCFTSVAFWAIGYGFMFGTNSTGFFGTDTFFLHGESGPLYTIVFFQMMLAATTATILSGAVAERMRYIAYIASAVLVVTFIYPLYGSWVWNDGGWLRKLGFIDFAGSSVVHAVGGWVALAGVIVLGPRMGRYSKRNIKSEKSRIIPGHNLPLVALGGMLLWVGFFGFSGGGFLEANPSIGLVLVNTHLAGAGGAVGVFIVLKLTSRRVLLTYTINGGLAGLVSICAGANTMEPVYALLTGLIAGILVIYSMSLLEKCRLDDAVGAISAHGTAGTWGIISVALFSSEHFFDLHQLAIQSIGAIVCFVWSFSLALVVFAVVGLVLGLRVDTADEQRGLDYAEHNEVGYPEFQRDMIQTGPD